MGTGLYFALAVASFLLGMCAVFIVVARPAARFFQNLMISSRLQLPMEHSRDEAIRKSTPGRLIVQAVIGLVVSTVVGVNVGRLLWREGMPSVSVGLVITVLAVGGGVAAAVGVISILGGLTRAAEPDVRQRVVRTRIGIVAAGLALLLLVLGVVLLH